MTHITRQSIDEFITGSEKQRLQMHAARIIQQIRQHLHFVNISLQHTLITSSQFTQNTPLTSFSCEQLCKSRVRNEPARSMSSLTASRVIDSQYDTSRLSNLRSLAAANNRSAPACI